MIRPNLRCLVAALVCLIFPSAAVHAQYAPHGAPGHPHLLQLPQSSYQAPIVDHYIQGDPNAWDGDQPIEKFLGNVVSHSWLRVEFLMWNYRRPGDGIIGAPVNGLEQGVYPNQIEGITAPVNLNDNPVYPAAQFGQTLFPTLASLENQDIPGVRGTWGIDLNGAELELSFFGMGQSSDEFFQDIAGPRQRLALQDPAIDPALGTTTQPNYAIPLLNNGVIPSVADGTFGTIGPLSALAFTNTLNIEMESQLWGTELALLTAKRIPGGVGPSWQWLGGFRYVNLDETFSISGTSLVGPPSHIKSSTLNNLYGPEFGGRAAFTSRWVTFSATPRVTFGLNDRTSTVVSNVLGVAGPRISDRTVEFGTITQLNLATEFHFSPAFSMFGGYDFMWMTGVTRPYENIVYNSVTNVAGDVVPEIGQHTNITNFMAHGFTIGAVFRY